MLYSIFVVSSVKITRVKRQFKEKLSFAALLKKIVGCGKIRLRETSIMKKGGQQTDGYLVCRTFYEKISDEICTYCFCCVCYASLEEYCEFERDD